jgi:hypothetical protein
MDGTNPGSCPVTDFGIGSGNIELMLKQMITKIDT